MNAQRLNDIYSNIRIAEKSDIESIRQLTVDYPFYHLPYVVLAKYYYDTSHYKFEDMLRQAAMRVDDRKELYHYIHGNDNNTGAATIDPDEVKYEEPVSLVPEHAIVTLEPEALSSQEVEVFEKPVVEQETPFKQVDVVEAPAEDIVIESKGIEDFLQDFGSEEQKPEEFVFEGKHEHVNLADIEIDRDVIGEEIATEFSFSRSFQNREEDQEFTQPVIETEQVVSDFSVEETESPQPAQKFEPQPDLPQIDDLETEEPEEETFIMQNSAEELRKNPVYKLETFLGEETREEETEEDLSPEKDFFAWLQHPHYTTEIKPERTEEVEGELHKKMDIIDRFININPQISRPKKEFFNPENMAKKSEVIDLEYVTETLAEIYKEQGNFELAVRAYEKLSLQNPSKQAYFASLIEKIKKERK